MTSIHVNRRSKKIVRDGDFIFLLPFVGWSVDRWIVGAWAGYRGGAPTAVAPLQALPAKLTEAQASQALDPVLEQIGQATDANTLAALVQALQAPPAQLTEAPGSQGAEAVLKQMDKATDDNSLRALAEALTALAPKLT